MMFRGRIKITKVPGATRVDDRWVVEHLHRGIRETVSTLWRASKENGGGYYTANGGWFRTLKSARRAYERA